MDRSRSISEICTNLEGRSPESLLPANEVAEIAQVLGKSVEWLLGGAELLSVAEVFPILERARGIEQDMNTLPLAEGDCLPPEADLALVAEAAEGNPALDLLLEEFLSRLEAQGLASVSEFYNAFRVPNPEMVTFFWEGLRADPRISAALDLTLRGMDGLSGQAAEAELRNKLTGRPCSGITDKVPSMLLSKILSRGINRAFSRALMKRLREQPFPLLPNGPELQDLESFCTSLELSMEFEKMDLSTHAAMIANPLGQAQTANTDAASNYFRSRERQGEEVKNNFGYVYLTEKQSRDLGVSEDSTARPLRYMGEAYLAVPVGLYLSSQFPEEQRAALGKIHALAEAQAGTPVATYYEKLAAYYELGSGELRGEAFLKAYYELCYEAERAWVHYVRYAVEQGLPYLHIHPFERYGTQSTKSHELALALINPDETGIFLEAKADFKDGAQHFLEDSGILERWPVMAEQSLKHVDSAVMVSLAARMHSLVPNAIAQNIPDEEAGKREGIVTLFDTAFSKIVIPSGRGGFLRARDGVGGLAEVFDRDVQDPQKFMDHYVLVVAGHELNHNMFKGNKQPTQGTGDGLSVNTIEEAKASEGVAFMFPDGRRLKTEELEGLRGALPLIVPWFLSRLMDGRLAKHRSEEYLREGASLLDHMMKSGLLQVARLRVTADGFVEKPLEGGLADDEFEFLRYDLSDAAVQGFITGCVDFMERLAPDYQQAEFEEPQVGRVIPDWTHIDTWQALSRLCYDRDMNKNGADVAALQAQKAKIKPGNPQNEEMVRALLRFADKEQPKQLRQALQVGRGVTDEDLEEALGAFKKEVLESHPQIIY